MAVDRALWLRQAREVMAQDHGPQPGEVRITLRSDSGARSQFVLSEEPAAGGAAAALSPLERDALRVVRGAKGEWLSAKVIALKLRLTCDNAFRAILKNLCEREPPQLESSVYGYRLPGGPPQERPGGH